jgi:hypothetical protein
MPTIRTCQTCGTDFPQPAPTGRPPKYCSQPCRAQARSRKPELAADSDFVQAETWPAEPTA